MKKRFSNKIVLISVLCLVIAGAITAFAIENPNLNQVNPPQHNDHPEPRLKADYGVEGVTFKSKEEILKDIEEHRQKSIGSSVKSVVMKTYTEYQSEDDTSNGISFEIDPNRTVWVVIVDYPNGIDTKAGFYDKATLIVVLDAQTGQCLESGVNGIYEGPGLPWVNRNLQK